MQMKWVMITIVFVLEQKQNKINQNICIFYDGTRHCNKLQVHVIRQ
jgi:hypothetical protein